MKKQQSYHWWVFLGLSLYLFLALSNHISIAEGQLGYFIREGAIFWEQGELLFSNQLSYTNPNYPMNNNHWLASFFFFGIQQFLGFGGLHFLGTLAYCLGVAFLLKILVQSTPPIFVALIGVLAVPLLAMHNLINPVLFSHLFSLLFFSLLYQYLNDKKSVRWLFILPIIQIFWVNCHSYFFIGWGLLTIAFIQAFLYQKPKAAPLLSITIASLVASFIHPQFATGTFGAISKAFTTSAFLPIWERTTLDAYLLTHSYSLLYVLVMSIITLLGSLFYVFKIRNSIPNFFVPAATVLFTFFAFWNNQLIFLLGITWIAIALLILDFYLIKYPVEPIKNIFLTYNPPIVSLYALLPIFLAAGFAYPISNLGYGLRANETEVVDFINQADIQGPFFHNSAISGLMAYGLKQQQPLYLSSQALAHPNDFLTQKYFPQILDPISWKAIHDEYQFNAILFRLKNEATAQLEFMGNLLGNGKWAMVYFKKDYEVLLLKRNEKNQALIRQYEISPNTE